MKYINISIHDVTPAFWEEVKFLVEFCKGLGISSATLLVIPDFHSKYSIDEHSYFLEGIKDFKRNGWEICMHGFTHLEDIVKPKDFFTHIVSNVYTKREGEFYLLSESEANNRIKKGVELFKKSDLDTDGFVAPAWLLSEGTKKVLYNFGFRYTTTLRGIYDLEKKKFYKVPVITFSSRSSWRAAVSCVFVRAVYLILRNKSMMRLALHPFDARNSGIMRVVGEICKKELAYRREISLNEMLNVLRNA